jgi:ATP phosphoribosyltransferase regulatory subunit HisZ
MTHIEVVKTLMESFEEPEDLRAALRSALPRRNYQRLKILGASHESLAFNAADEMEQSRLTERVMPKILAEANRGD